MLQSILDNLKSKNTETDSLVALQVLIDGAVQSNSDFFETKANCFALLNELFGIGNFIADDKIKFILERITNKYIVNEFIQQVGFSINAEHPLYFTKLISFNDTQLLVNLLNRAPSAASIVTYLTNPIDSKNSTISRLEYLLSVQLPVDFFGEIFQRMPTVLAEALSWRWALLSPINRENHWDRLTNDQKIQLLQFAVNASDSTFFRAIWPYFKGDLRRRILTDVNLTALRNHSRITAELVKEVSVAFERWDFTVVAALHQCLGENLGPILERAILQHQACKQERFVQTLCNAVAAPANGNHRDALKYMLKWAIDHGYFKYPVNVKFKDDPDVTRVCLQAILPRFTHHQQLFNELVTEFNAAVVAIGDAVSLQRFVQEQLSFFWGLQPTLYLKIIELDDAKSMEYIVSRRYSVQDIENYLNEPHDNLATMQQTRLHYLLLQKPALVAPIFRHRPGLVLSHINDFPELIAALRAQVGDELYIHGVCSAVGANWVIRPQLAAIISELTSAHPHFPDILRLGLEHVVNGTHMLNNIVIAFAKDPASAITYPDLAKAIWIAVNKEATDNKIKPERSEIYCTMEFCYIQSLSADQLIDIDSPPRQFKMRSQSLCFDGIFQYFLQKHRNAEEQGCDSDEWRRYEERLTNYVTIHQFIRDNKDDPNFMTRLGEFITAMPKPTSRKLLFFIPASNDTYNGLRSNLTIIPPAILIRRWQEMEAKIRLQAQSPDAAHPISQLAERLNLGATTAVAATHQQPSG